MGPRSEAIIELMRDIQQHPRMFAVTPDDASGQIASLAAVVVSDELQRSIQFGVKLELELRLRATADVYRAPE